jgi:hypothetical protein
MDNQQGSVTIAGNPDGAAAGGQQASWYQGFPDEVRGLVETKGWQTPVDAITSYANLEKFLGADKAGRGLVLPKEDAGADEWGQVYDRLGRPKAPDGYKLPVPQGDTGEFAQAAAKVFHEAGLSTKQAEALASWWNQTQQQMAGSQEQSLVQNSEIEMAQLQQEWGRDFDSNIEAGRRAARQFGVDADTISAMESAIGTRKTMELFTKIGKGLTEDTFVDGSGNRGFGVSPEAARVRIGQLKADPEWTAKYLGGNADAKAEMDRLIRAAYPE